MLAGLLIVLVVGFLAILSHRHTKIEEKIVRDVPLSEWFGILIFPLTFYLGWVFIVKNILDRPMIFIFPLDDFDILAVTILFLVYGSVGNALHFVSKVTWKNLKDHKNTMAYKVNEMFHNKLSHYLVYLNSLFILFMLPLLEINHPLETVVLRRYLIEVALAGVVFGLLTTKAIFFTDEWFGGYNKPLFFIVGVLFFSLLGFVKFYGLRFSVYPAYLFVVCMFAAVMVAYLFRQFFIFACLDRKKRLKFLAKFLSV